MEIKLLVFLNYKLFIEDREFNLLLRGDIDSIFGQWNQRTSPLTLHDFTAILISFYIVLKGEPYKSRLKAYSVCCRTMMIYKLSLNFSELP